MTKEVKITVKGVRRAEPDLARLARALLLQVLAERRDTRASQQSSQPRKAAS